MLRPASRAGSTTLIRSLLVSLLAAAMIILSAGPAHAGKAPKPVSVRLIAFNDLHGNLQPPAGSSGRVTLADGSTVDAGGAAYLSTTVKQLRAQSPNAVVLSSGDNIGASPLASALFHDEPTIAVLNQLGLTASAVGNHEFDEGYKELLRMQLGGCHPTDGCQFTSRYKGANFPFLGANVSFDNGLPALLPFTITRKGGVPIGVIGVTLKDLPTVVVPSGIQGLQFTDEVRAIDRTSALLHKLGVEAQVVIMHQGDEPAGVGGPDSCQVEAGGPATAIATRASARVDAFFSAHTHQQYSCVVTDPAGKPRPLIQGLSFGRLLSVVDVKIDPRTRDVLRPQTTAHNVVVARTVTPDPAVQKVIDDAVTQSAPIANQQVGSITADLVRAVGPSGETPLGDVIADAQLASTQDNGAVIAMTNIGGIRADLVYDSSDAGEGDGVVTYGEAFTVQPFSNILQTITLTGAQLDTVLEQQWVGQVSPRIMQVSAGFTYSWSAAAPNGSKVSGLALNGTPIDPAATYRVTVNNFLAAGGDGFTEFTNGTDLTGGAIDLDAFTAYLTANPNLAPPAANRITLNP